jgi:hypothetical protein
MAEVLIEYPELVLSQGVAYRAQACGAPMPEGRWEGWIEFVPATKGEPPVRTGRETTQPNRADTVYWATGLTPVYLEGALERALEPPPVRRVSPRRESVFDGPKDAVVTAGAPSSTPPEEAILDPFSVYEKGEALLRRQLGALSAWHLVNIIVAYELSELPRPSLNRMEPAALIDVIVAAVAAQATTR